MGEGADRLRNREIIIELIDYGDVVRVTAIDAATGVEATASGPPATARADLERLAARKLANKLFGPVKQGGETQAPGGGRRGKLI